MSAHQLLRTALGRTAVRTVYAQYDCGTRRIRPASVVDDPILDLYVARQNRKRTPTGLLRYAEIRARVMKPAKLQHDHWADPLFRMAQRDCVLAIKTFQQLDKFFGRAA